MISPKFLYSKTLWSYKCSNYDWSFTLKNWRHVKEILEIMDQCRCVRYFLSGLTTSLFHNLKPLIFFFNKYSNKYYEQNFITVCRRAGNWRKINVKIRYIMRKSFKHAEITTILEQRSHKRDRIIFATPQTKVPELYTSTIFAYVIFPICQYAFYYRTSRYDPTILTSRIPNIQGAVG